MAMFREEHVERLRDDRAARRREVRLETVELDLGWSPSAARKRRSTARASDVSRPIALYAPTAPESLPGRRRATERSISMRSPSRETYSAIAKPKVIGSA